ncbi:hypothetical protein [Pleionea sediminis]|uniref:hypothetical protein n=1 Tax=Pleionea sediminis TaxID=2569479 RepID=UPI001185C8AE|nr:hypothetical protein [Pleionea sediminis]
MSRFLFYLLLLFSTLTFAESESLSPFTSDGCSMFPDGTFEQQKLWLNCCTEHDRAYWAGGTKAERKAADIKLKQCVESVGEPKIAKLMLAGVRVGGSPHWPTRFRWGYGWPFGRGYAPLTEDEVEQVTHLWSLHERTQKDGE